jgi:anti-anti-sigma regulatory factor
MRKCTGGNLNTETVSRGVQVMRFARPDVREYLDNAGETEMSPLFQEIEEAVLSHLSEGWTLVINMAVIEPINAAFYRCLLAIRSCVNARQCRLVLCGLTPRHRQVFELFRGPEVFRIADTEAMACRDLTSEFAAPACGDSFRERIRRTFWVKSAASASCNPCLQAKP